MDTDEDDDSDDTDDDVSIGFVVQSLLISQVMYTITNIIQFSEPNPKNYFGYYLEFLWPYRWIPFLILAIIGIILSLKWITRIFKEIKSMIGHHDDKILMIWNSIKILFHVLILEAIVFCPIMTLPDVLPYDLPILDNVEGGLLYVPIGLVEYPLGSIITFILELILVRLQESLQPSGNETLLY